MSDAPFRRTVRLALLGGLAAAPAAHAQEAPVPDAASDATPAAGSRLAQGGGALPVTVITREEIDASGRSSLADILRDLSFNSFGSFRPQSGSSAQGLAALSLRGLGAERTLILVDGKRAPQAPYAPTAQDLNAIPLGAVERIEILREGVSAIYGSGAIGGVINIVLRQDFQGAQLMHGRGYTDTGGGDTSQAGFLMGMPAGSGNVVIGASYNTRDIMFARDLVAAGLDEPGASFFANNYVTPADGFSTVNPVPGGCQASDAFSIVDGREIGSGIFPPEPVPVCVYDFNRVAADEASLDNMGLFAKGRFAIGDDWSVYSTGSISRVKSFGRYAPAPAILFVPGAVSGIDHDGDGTDDTVYVYHRYDALGNRDNTIEGTVYDILAGFEGSLVGLQVDFGGRFNEYKSFDVGRNYVVNSLASAAATSGAYNFANPAANTPDVLNTMKATLARESTWQAQDYWANASTDLFPMPGGISQIAFGLDYHTAIYSDRYDSLSEGNQIGGSAGNSAGANRNVTGYFVEAYLPVLDKLDVTLAVRVDDYSDLQEAEMSPKVAVSYQPTDMVKVRGSYGQGFSAPALDIISMEPSFSMETFCTPGFPQVCTQVGVLVVRNPDLQSATADQYSLGFTVTPPGPFMIELDYYQTTVDDLIRFFTVGTLLSLELAGESLPLGLSLTRDPSQGNRLVSAVVGFGNHGALTTSGVNLDATFRRSYGALGNLRSNLMLGWVLGYEFSDDGVDQVGLQGAPEYRWNWNTDYKWQQFGFGWNQSYIASQARGADAWYTHDIQVNYDMPFNAGKLTVGALNVTNEMPPRYEYDGRPFNFYLYNAYGRTPYVRYTLAFR